MCPFILSFNIKKPPLKVGATWGFYPFEKFGIVGLISGYAVFSVLLGMSKAPM